MIERHSVKLLGRRRIFDLDMRDDDSWLAMVGHDVADAVIVHEAELRLVRRFRYPIIRWLGSSQFVVVDARTTSSAAENGMIVHLDSPQDPICFHAGDGIADLLVTSNFIVTTYFDEGVFGNIPISQDGLAVFDHNGNHQFGYRSRLTSHAVDVADCYAACSMSGDDIAFSAYTGFPLVIWNPKTESHQTAELPPSLHGISAMSAYRDEFFLYSPYGSKRTMFRYVNGDCRQIAELDGRLKAIRNGRFIRVEDSGFSVIDCRDAM